VTRDEFACVEGIARRRSSHLEQRADASVRTLASVGEELVSSRVRAPTMFVRRPSNGNVRQPIGETWCLGKPGGDKLICSN
jgi:hypothetical protein